MASTTNFACQTVKHTVLTYNSFKQNLKGTFSINFWRQFIFAILYWNKTKLYIRSFYYSTYKLWTNYGLGNNGFCRNKFTSNQDNIHSCLMSDGFSVLSVLLKYLFNVILKSTVMSELRKFAKLCSINKSDGKTNNEHGRQISIPNLYARVSKTISHNRIYQFIRRIISTHQHGFMTHKSLISNLADCIFV